MVTIPALVLGLLTGLSLTYSYLLKSGRFSISEFLTMLLIYAIPVITLELLTMILFEKQYTFEQLTVTDTGLIFQIGILPLIPVTIISSFLISKYYLTDDFRSFGIALLACSVILIGIAHNIAIINTVKTTDFNDFIRLKTVEYIQLLVPLVVFISVFVIFDRFNLIEANL